MRVSVLVSQGDWFASPAASCKIAASLAAANYLPSSPGVLATRSSAGSRRFHLWILPSDRPVGCDVWSAAAGLKRIVLVGLCLQRPSDSSISSQVGAIKTGFSLVPRAASA